MVCSYREMTHPWWAGVSLCHCKDLPSHLDLFPSYESFFFIGSNSLLSWHFWSLMYTWNSYLSQSAPSPSQHDWPILDLQVCSKLNSSEMPSQPHCRHMPSSATAHLTLLVSPPSWHLPSSVTIIFMCLPVHCLSLHWNANTKVQRNGIAIPDAPLCPQSLEQHSTYSRCKHLLNGRMNR